MKIPAWSYSSLTNYETCPYQYYNLKVAKKYKQGDTEATIWGKEVHGAFEHRIKEGTPLPGYATKWEPLMGSLLKKQAAGAQLHTEMQLGITKDFQPCGFHDDGVWARCIVDLAIIDGEHGFNLDYKTGKRKPGSRQLEMSSAVLFAHYPELQSIKTGFVWLKEKKLDRDEHKRHEVPIIWQGFIGRVRRMEKSYEDDNWPVKTSGLCNGWCPVTGCKYWKERRK